MRPALEFFEQTVPYYISLIPTYKIVLIERVVEPYFKSVNISRDPAFWTSGQQRRSISNHQELADRLSKEFGDDFKNISLERTSIYYQYHLFRSADIVIAQHGGGLSNIVFMREEAHVIEFSPPWGRDSNHFLNLAAFKGVGYTRLLQDADHGPVDISETVQTIQRLQMK